MRRNVFPTRVKAARVTWWGLREAVKAANTLVLPEPDNVDNISSTAVPRCILEHDELHVAPKKLNVSSSAMNNTYHP